jgi:hypothetical protein
MALQLNKEIDAKIKKGKKTKKYNRKVKKGKIIIIDEEVQQLEDFNSNK